MKNKQKGFSVVEILVAVVIVGLLGVVGWLVYNQHNKPTASIESSKTTKSSELKIKEFGLTITLPPKLQGVTYVYNGTGSTDKNGGSGPSSSDGGPARKVVTIDLVAPEAKIKEICVNQFGNADTFSLIGAFPHNAWPIASIVKVDGKYYPTAYWDGLLKQYDDAFIALSTSDYPCANAPKGEINTSTSEFLLPEISNAFSSAVSAQ